MIRAGAAFLNERTISVQSVYDNLTRSDSFPIKCLGQLLRISYLEHKTSGWVRNMINFLVGS